MRNGIFFPATAVRIAVGTMAAVVIALAVASTPDAVRYFKMKTM